MTADYIDGIHVSTLLALLREQARPDLASKEDWRRAGLLTVQPEKINVASRKTEVQKILVKKMQLSPRGEGVLYPEKMNAASVETEVEKMQLSPRGEGVLNPEKMNVASIKTEVEKMQLSPRGRGVLNHLLKLLLTFRGSVTVVIADENAMRLKGARFKSLDRNGLKGVFDEYAPSCHHHGYRKAFQVILQSFIAHKCSDRWETWSLRKLSKGLGVECFPCYPIKISGITDKATAFTVGATILAICVYDFEVLIACVVLFLLLVVLTWTCDWILPDAFVSSFYTFPGSLNSLRRHRKDGAIVISETGKVLAAAVKVDHDGDDCRYDGSGSGTRHSAAIGLADWMGRMNIPGAVLVGSESGALSLVLPSATADAPRLIEVDTSV